MAVVNNGQPPITLGLLGIGLDTNEAILDLAGAKLFPSLLDQMVKQHIIPAKAYSLYLDDYESTTGSVIFGGYDTSRFQDSLYVMPMVPAQPGGQIYSFNVLWTSFGITDAGGSKVIPSSTLPVPVLLDSGSTFSTFPRALWKSLVSYFRADVSDSEGDSTVDCGFREIQASVDFGMGGSNGPIISVPFSEMVVPNGDGTCSLGAIPSTGPDDPPVFGDTMLRSANVVYDLDNLLIGMAPTVFDASDSNSVPFGSNGVLSVPNTINLTQASAIPSPFVGGPSVTAAPLPEESGTGPIEGFTTSYTNRHLPTPQSKAQGAQNGGMSTVAFASGSFLAMALGGALTVLL